MSRQFRAVSIAVHQAPFGAKDHDGKDYLPEELKDVKFLVIAKDRKGDHFVYAAPYAKDQDLEAVLDPRSWPKTLFRDYWRFLCGTYESPSQLSPHNQAYLSGSVTYVLGG